MASRLVPHHDRHSSKYNPARDHSPGRTIGWVGPSIAGMSEHHYGNGSGRGNPGDEYYAIVASMQEQWAQQQALCNAISIYKPPKNPNKIMSRCQVPALIYGYSQTLTPAKGSGPYTNIHGVRIASQRYGR